MIIIEAIIIGLYVSLLFNLILIYIPLFLKLFIIGFIKHSLSYYIGIQSYYCKLYKDNNYSAKVPNLFMESIFEGLIFIYIGYILKYFINPDINNYLFPFILGFIIHIIADFYNIHKLFLLYNCKLQ